MYRQGTLGWTCVVLLVALVSWTSAAPQLWDSSDSDSSEYVATGRVLPYFPSSEETVSTKWPALSVGSKVVRGPDWMWGDQGSGTVGTVTGSIGSTYYTVRWGDGHTNMYRYGLGGKYDIKLATEVSSEEDTTTTTASTTTARSSLLPVGTRVRRGPDWMWSNQDRGGLGTVQGPSVTDGWFYVRWANGDRNSYRYGAGGKYDLKIVTGDDSDSDSSEEILTPTTTVSSMPTLKAGDKVVRYKDWSWGSQDVGGIGTVVVMLETLGVVHVRWTDGSENNYNYGRNGLYDVRRATEDEARLAREETTTIGSGMPTLSIGDKVVRGEDWKWGDQGNNTVGTVDGALTSRLWISVTWADGHQNNYRYGHDGKYDIQLATSPRTRSLETSPRTWLPGCPLKIGDKVVRGPGWMWSSQDVGIGVVISKGSATSGWLRVRWSDDSTNSYRCGVDDDGDSGFDVKLATASDIASITVAPRTARTTTTTARSAGSRPTLTIGTKVVRGDDWKWGSQDKGTTGTVVEELDSDEWIKVRWGDGSTNSYRYGYQSKYDLKPAPEDDDSSSHEVASSEEVSTPAPPKLKVGDKVVRGADWKWGDQGSGTLGTVDKVDGFLAVLEWVRVRWADGETNAYRYGDDGAYDVRLATEAEIATLSTRTIPMSTPPPRISMRRLPETLTKGDRVVRGPTWKWDDQDVGVGRVLGDLSPGWVKVRWEDGSGHVYRYNPVRSLFDVQLDMVASGSDSEEEDMGTSTTPESTMSWPALKKGDRVIRGPNWRWGNQGGGTMGTVKGPSHTDWISVRWDNGDEYNYRYGDDGAYDIKLADSEEEDIRTTTNNPEDEDEALLGTTFTTNIPVTTTAVPETTEVVDSNEFSNVAPSMSNVIEEY